uniref:Semaphorin 4D n=1 Tax=Suricata suricatta TaxID=37032 RepID=A0A673VIJ1_SURSU
MWYPKRHHLWSFLPPSQGTCPNTGPSFRLLCEVSVSAALAAGTSLSKVPSVWSPSGLPHAGGLLGWAQPRSGDSGGFSAPHSPRIVPAVCACARVHVPERAECCALRLRVGRSALESGAASQRHPSPGKRGVHARGPADVHFVWEKNGRELETCVPTQSHALPDGRAHALSWLRDAISESATYRCSVLSAAGNRTSRVRVTVVRSEASHQEQWTQELATWKAVAGEHNRLMHSWRKAWVCGWAQGGWGLAGCLLPCGGGGPAGTPRLCSWPTELFWGQQGGPTGCVPLSERGLLSEQ